MSTEATQAVLNHHLECFGANDLDGLMSDYAEDVVFLTLEGVVRGHDNIRKIFEGFFAVFPTGEMSLEMLNVSADGEWAYILWSGEGPAHTAPLGTDTFCVRDGKIVMQSFAAKLDPK
jgi:uncharacterized protein (TIGR02246 family)